MALWFDTRAVDPAAMTGTERVDWFRVLPFLAAHLACLGALWVGWSATAVAVAAALVALRMFAVTGFYHRYFSHRAVRQGHYWWEVDLTFYLLWILSSLGIIWNLRPIPRRSSEAS